MPRITKKAGTYHHGDLRRVLLEAAVRVVEKEGVTALSLQALARRAGVSSGAPYHHFESREQLLSAIAVQGLERLTAELRRSVEAAPPDARSRLEALGRGYIRFALSHRGHFRVMFRPEFVQHLTHEQREALGESYAMLEQAIDRCQHEGLAPPGDPTRLVLLAWSAVHGASVLWIDGSLGEGELVRDEAAFIATVAGTVVELLAGVGSRPQ